MLRNCTVLALLTWLAACGTAPLGQSAHGVLFLGDEDDEPTSFEEYSDDTTSGSFQPAPTQDGGPPRHDVDGGSSVAPALTPELQTADGLWERYIEPRQSSLCGGCHGNNPLGTGRTSLAAGHPPAEMPPVVEHVLASYASLAAGAAQRAPTKVLLNEIHIEKGMHCIDCHFLQDSHGDGNLYAR
jgi:hypothetical protein